jgi:glutaredoxin
MDMPGHICPFGLKARDLLQRSGFEVEDHRLRSREETERFKAENHVKTTPQIFVDGQRVGGYDDLRAMLGKGRAAAGVPSYRPVAALFAMTAALAVAASQAAFGIPFTQHTLMWFVAFSMCVLALLKLQDVEKFSTMFLNYDLLARRWVPYSYVYPYAEGLAGVLMAAGVARWLSVPVALFIGGIGAVSVFRAVYIEKRELKCTCVGGSSNVPLGFVSLAENLGMIAMALGTLAI